MRPKDKDPFKVGYNICVSALAEDARTRLTRMRGDLKSRALLIASVPNEEDCKMNMPLSNPTWAREFHLLMENEVGLNTEEDFLVMAGTPFANVKPTKKLVEPFANLLSKHQSRFKLVVVIGSDNFKFYFGRGKKSSLQTLASGRPVFLAREWPHLPIMVLPEIRMLAPEWQNDDNDWKLEQARDFCAKWLRRLMPGVRKTYDTYVK